MDTPRQEGPDKDTPIKEQESGKYQRFEDQMDRMGLMLSTADLERSRAFYEAMGFAVMQRFPHESENPEGYSLTYERTHLLLFSKMTQMFPWLKQGRGSGLLPYIEVDEISPLYNALKGSEYIKEDLEDKPWGHRLFVFTDPDDHTLAFYQTIHKHR